MFNRDSVIERSQSVKKFSILILSILFLTSFAIVSNSSEKDKGSMMKMRVKTDSNDTVSSSQDDSMKKSDSSEWGVAHSARALIGGTQSDSEVSGTVDFVETGDGVQVVASLSNVSPAGKHGIHIHQNGSCEDNGKAAGGHFNPTGTDHGLLPRDGHGKAHTGDMGNIEIDENGNGSLVIFLVGLSLTEGHRNIVEKAVILHAKEDDFGQPTGNAGSRIGCGLIALNK